MTTSLHRPKYPVAVQGVGFVPCPLMVVGEAPGRKEIEYGAPFVGPSGSLLDYALRLAGHDRGSVYITNAFKGDVGVGNRNPTQGEIDDHRPLLEAEISTVDPRRILLLGRIATEVFLGNIGRMSDIVGTERMGASGRTVVPTWHPAYVLRQGEARRDEFFEHVRRWANE